MAQDTVADDFATRIETRGIDLIGDAERHGRARDLFAVWAAPNVSILNFTIGASLILLGLEIWQAVTVILISSTLWIFPGIVAISGPAAGTSGSVITRAIYGVIGNRLIVALVGWLIGSVYLALNWLGSSFLGADLVGRLGIGDSVWTPIVVTLVISAITVLVAVYGHGLILKTYGVVSLVLVGIFVLVAAFALPHADLSYANPEPLTGVALWSSITIGFTLLASSPLSYINSPDLARYLPRSTKPSHIAAATALGGAIPNILFTTIGVLVATGVGAAIQTEGIEKALIGILPAWLGPILVVGVVVNTISLNAMTTYTSSMALQAIGLPIRRVPAAVVVGVLGTILTIVLVLSTSLLGAVNLILQFVVIVSAPTMMIFVVDVLLRRGRYDGVELFDESRTSRFWFTGGWSVPGMTAVTLGALVTAMGLTTEVWSGPIAIALGYVDLSVPMGIVVTAVVYLALRKTPLAGSQTQAPAPTPRHSQEGPTR